MKANILVETSEKTLKTLSDIYLNPAVAPETRIEAAKVAMQGVVDICYAVTACKAVKEPETE